MLLDNVDCFFKARFTNFPVKEKVFCVFKHLFAYLNSNAIYNIINSTVNPDSLTAVGFSSVPLYNIDTNQNIANILPTLIPGIRFIPEIRIYFFSIILRQFSKHIIICMNMVCPKFSILYFFKKQLIYILFP